MPSTEFQEAVERMARENRFRATVFAMNTLLVKKGVYSPGEFEEQFLEWDEKERNRSAVGKKCSILGTDAILDCVARHFGLNQGELTTKNNSQRVSTPRRVAMYILREVKDMSFPVIARRFGMHHTTVMEGVRVIEERRKDDPAMNAMIQELTAELN